MSVKLTQQELLQNKLEQYGQIPESKYEKYTRSEIRSVKANKSRPVEPTGIFVSTGPIKPIHPLIFVIFKYSPYAPR